MIPAFPEPPLGSTVRERRKRALFHTVLRTWTLPQGIARDAGLISVVERYLVLIASSDAQEQRLFDLVFEDPQGDAMFWEYHQSRDDD